MRAGDLSVGLTLVPDAKLSMVATRGLDTRAGCGLVRQMHDPTASPFYFEGMSHYDKAEFITAVERFCGDSTTITT